MKRFVLLVCAVMISCAAEAGDAAALFRSYSEKEGVTAVTLTRKSFNLMKPFLGLHHAEVEERASLGEVAEVDEIEIEPLLPRDL